MDSHNEWVSYLDHNVLPKNYDVPVMNSISKTGIPSLFEAANSQLFYAILLSLIGFSLILILEKLGNKKQSK
jgi:hypothetical protein